MNQAGPTLVCSTLQSAQTARMHKPRHIHPLQWAMAAFSLLAALSAHYAYFSAYAVLKPLPMVFGMACAWFLARPSRYPIAWALLLLGLFLSMVGDISLLFKNGFVMGLAAFLCAHIAYIFMLRRETTRWLPSASAAILCAAAGAALYSYLWTHGLPHNLRWPVLAYVCVIATMAAQAIGRAKYLRTPAAVYVAAGAISFMVSDSILAMDKFVAAVPGAYLWVLGTYYLAQWLIVHGMLSALRERSS